MSSLGFRVKKYLVNFPISLLSFIGIVLGFLFGFAAKYLNTTSDFISVIGYLGILFINSLKAMVLLFVVIVMVRTPMDMKEISQAKAFASMAIVYYVLTSFLASTIGILFANLVKPGSNKTFCDAGASLVKIEGLQSKSILDTFFDIGKQALPKNMFEALVKDNIIGILVVFLTIGFYLSRQTDTEGGIALKGVLDVLYTAVMDVLYLIISCTPVGIFSIVAEQIARIENFCVFGNLIVYIATFILSCGVHALIVYPLIYFAIVRKNPYSYYRKFLPSAMTAFATASSAAALPMNIKGAMEAGVDMSVLNFVLPLGATLNMDGSSIYYPVTIIFVANTTGQSLTVGMQIVLAIVSAVVTIGSAPIPSGALVYLLLVADTVGIKLPSQSISLIWAIDFLMDRTLTTVNVTGDAYAAGIIASLKDKFYRRKGGDVESSSPSPSDIAKQKKVNLKHNSSSLLDRAEVMRRESMKLLRDQNTNKD